MIAIFVKTVSPAATKIISLYFYCGHPSGAVVFGVKQYAAFVSFSAVPARQMLSCYRGLLKEGDESRRG
ncbi:Hypothetical Protein XCAW_01205 [Xanthomonas citri subsp. citri Aw12879]|nr:Hypothetical Protein XCAW_01205 [Xanthomonas citri subsp. citri Aw12879]